MTAYYNEIDPYAAQWLRNLIAAGHIAPGDVDERDIRDIKPDDLKKYTQCHFFAGIGVWSLALRQAGWPDDRPVWTGSCPCQPFSAAGRKGGFVDERHLWPHWYHLITQLSPECVFGEQVASKDGLGWLDLVQADLEGADYANTAVDLCAAGVGAPHIRQRLWFAAERLADPSDTGLQGRKRQRQTGEEEQPGGHSTQCGGTDRLADTHRDRCTKDRQRVATKKRNGAERDDGVAAERPTACPTNGFWGAADWLFCRDGRWRAVEPGTSPLANGATCRVGKLRAYGNAINAEVAQTFIESYLEGCVTDNAVLQLKLK